MKPYILIPAALFAIACGGGDEADGGELATADGGQGVATAMASGSAELTPEQLEAGRLDGSWRQFADRDAGERAGASTASSRDTSSQSRSAAADDGTAGRSVMEAGPAGTGGGGPSGDTTSTESWDDISAQSVNSPPGIMPVHGDIQGPSVAKVQILLDQARFSPGIIDGRWGKNTEKAVYWFQQANGIEATGRVDQQTLDALQQAAGAAEQITRRQLTEADVSGPFENLPEDVYARADQPCLCYESQREQLGEVFHSSPELLEQLNPDVDLNNVGAGTALHVPAVDPFHLGELPEGKYTSGGEVARVVISDGGHYVHALDDGGNILYHFPSTLGSDYAPSPTGEFTVESITFDPTWHYKPDLLTGVDPSKPDAVLPAGPNNAVGIVWMQLSKDHYGVHGTSAPETIGYATSHGCVRLTNWDAGTLGQRIPPGVPVEFRDVSG